MEYKSNCFTIQYPNLFGINYIIYIMDSGLVINKFKKAVESSGEAIFMTDLDGTITYVNPEFSRLYGYSFEEVVGKTTPRIIKSGQNPPDFYQHFWQIISKGETVKGEITNKTKLGQLITVEGSANPIKDDVNNTIGYLAIQHDVTLRKKNERDLQVKITELKAINNFAIDRELKMIDLKKYIAELESKLPA